MDKYKNEVVEELTEAQWQLLSSSFKVNKELKKVIELAECIKLNTPDICLFTEVGGSESITNFNSYFLDNQFTVFHEPSNSDRGIDMAILVKKNISHRCQFQIHTDKVFARGVLNLSFKKDNGQLLRFFLTHLKSKLNKNGLDFEGRAQRAREVRKIIQIRKEFAQDDVVITGDLNGIIYKEQTEQELVMFETKAWMLDIFEHLDQPSYERCTYIYYNKQNTPLMMQLDYILLSKKLFSKYSATAQVLGFDGKKRINYPSNIKEKRQYPSDHYPILANFQLLTQ